MPKDDIVKATRIVLDDLIQEGKYKEALDFLVAISLDEFESEKAELAKKVFEK